MDFSPQEEWVERAARVLPAGGFGNFDPGVVIREGRGAHVWDEDGNEFIDYLIGSGPKLVGHSHPEVVEAVQAQAAKGMTFFASNALGIQLAEVICDAVACADQLRYVSTGGEADMYAMRLARTHTGRDKIVKFEGGYHGMSAESLVSLAPKRLQNFPLAVTGQRWHSGERARSDAHCPFQRRGFHPRVDRGACRGDCRRDRRTRCSAWCHRHRGFSKRYARRPRNMASS